MVMYKIYIYKGLVKKVPIKILDRIFKYYSEKGGESGGIID
jgi:hypothetical protein